MFSDILLSVLMVGNVYAASSDIDMDNVSDEKDLCKNVPGTNRGCPNFSLRKKSSKDTNQILVSQGVQSGNIKFEEETQIRLGDKIFAVMLDKASGKVFSKSPSKEVEY